MHLPYQHLPALISEFFCRLYDFLYKLIRELLCSLDLFADLRIYIIKVLQKILLIFLDLLLFYIYHQLVSRNAESNYLLMKT